MFFCPMGLGAGTRSRRSSAEVRVLCVPPRCFAHEPPLSESRRVKQVATVRKTLTVATRSVLKNVTIGDLSAAK
jgi:hypothetical protein